MQILATALAGNHLLPLHYFPPPPPHEERERMPLDQRLHLPRRGQCAMHLCDSSPARTVPDDRRHGLSVLSPFSLFHCRFQILWDEEIKRVGPERASLGRVVWKFQRTRVLMDVVANILCIIMAALGPVSGADSSELSPRSPAGQTMSLVTFSMSRWFYCVVFISAFLGGELP